MRPGWDQYFISLAVAVAARATCPRLSVGCVLVEENRVIGAGYNGAPAGGEHCTEAGCLVIGGGCKRTIHAERNAVEHRALPNNTTSFTAYTTHAPCLDCAALLLEEGCTRVVYLHDYKTPDYAAAGLQLDVVKFSED